MKNWKVDRRVKTAKIGCVQADMLTAKWGGQFCPQPPFRRPLRQNRGNVPLGNFADRDPRELFHRLDIDY